MEKIEYRYRFWYRYRPKFMVSDWYRIEPKKAGIAHHYWIDAGRPLDEKEITAVTLPVAIDHPASENMLENPSQIRTQRIYTKISTVLLVGREIR